MQFMKMVNAALLRKPFILKTIHKKYSDDVTVVDDIPQVSTALIKKTLNANGVSFEEGYACFITKCSTCRAVKTEARNNAKLYINKTTGMYMCSYCHLSGQWDHLDAKLSLNKTKRLRTKGKVENDFSEMTKIEESLNHIKENSRQLRYLTQEDLTTLLHKFKLPQISRDTFEHLDIRTNEKNTMLYFPLENSANQTVGYRTFHAYTPHQTTIPNAQSGGLLTMRAPKARDSAILVPNISDFLVLADARIGAWNVVCLSDGVNRLSQHVLPSLERFKKLVLWLGNDNKAWDSARLFAEKLGDKRCSLVRASELLPHLDRERDFRTIIGGARTMVHKSITTFGALRADVLSDLQNIDKVQGVKWKKFPTLNKILRGHRRGELTVLTGPTGCGKTTFVSEYSLDLAMQGVNTLWGSFEIRNARLMKTMLQQLAEIPLEENLHLFNHFADEFEKLPIYFMTFHGQQSIKVVMEAVEHATYIHDIGHVIIDNLQFMMGTSEDQKHMDRFWRQDVIIDAFRTFATRKNCHVTLVVHPRKERDDEDLTISSIFGGAKASQEADNILIIQDKRLTSVRGKKYLQVTKNRYTGDLGVMQLDFDKNSLSFTQKKIKKKCDKEASIAHVPNSSESIVDKNTTPNET